MDRTRHNADSTAKYEVYFELLHNKIKEYNVLPENTYTMDEKGFMIGVTGRSKRVFSREQWDKKEVRDSLQDGSRDWITVLASICADGTPLPPGIIFAAKRGALYNTCVADVKAGEHDVFLTSSPSGWSNNDIGIAWVEQLFNRCTKKKASHAREYRLLILDGHGSHLTMEFINYCDSHRILLAILPPHSTHTLQPLDLVMFKPLSSAYSNELTSHLHKGQGLIPIQKGDFFPLFWRAWKGSFKKKLILKSFEATGIAPIDRDVVLKHFAYEPKQASLLGEGDWRGIDPVFWAAVKDLESVEAKELRFKFHDLSTQSELLYHENDGLREALVSTKKRKKNGKRLDLQQRKEYHGGAVLWTPRKVREANARLAVKEREDKEERIRKADNKAFKQAASDYKKNIAAEKRVAAAIVKEEREKEKKAAQRAAEVEAQNTKKATQTSQKGKHKALKAFPSNNKRN